MTKNLPIILFTHTIHNNMSGIKIEPSQVTSIEGQLIRSCLDDPMKLRELYVRAAGAWGYNEETARQEAIQMSDAEIIRHMGQIK